MKKMQITEDFFRSSLNLLTLKNINFERSTKEAITNIKLLRDYIGVENTDDSYDSLLDDLVKMDKPFIYDVWDSFVIEHPYEKQLNMYLLAIKNNAIYNELSWKDSIFHVEKQIEIHNSNDVLDLVMMKSLVSPNCRYMPIVKDCYDKMLKEFKKHIYKGNLINYYNISYKGYSLTNEFINILDNNGFVYEVKEYKSNDDYITLNTMIQVDFIKTITKFKNIKDNLDLYSIKQLVDYLNSLKTYNINITIDC